MGSRLSGFFILGAFLASLPLDLSWTGDAITRRLRLYADVKLSLSALYAVLTPFPYVNNKITGSICE
jgi:hypothetical protein